jgi:cell division protein ZapE
MPMSIATRTADADPASLIADLVPPRRFASVRFATYTPAHPTQSEARDRLSLLVRELAPSQSSPRWGRLRRRAREERPPSVYLEGGFGVGKTHLLASMWHAAELDPARKVYATFAQLVHLVGSLSMRRAAEALQGTRLVCIDEFELDDPGNTRLIATLLRGLVECGASVVATSNTLPGQLGEGRFDAVRFRREIETLADAFETLRIEGEDYRHRGAMVPPPVWDEARVLRTATTLDGPATLDRGRELQRHLFRVHPVRYAPLVRGLSAVFVTEAEPVVSLPAALRTAWFVDALYDEEIPVGMSGVEVADLFPESFHRGAYRKLFGRCVSRLGALLEEAGRLAAT